MAVTKHHDLAGGWRRETRERAILISHLVRIAMISIAVNPDMGAVANQPNATDAQLAALQKKLGAAGLFLMESRKCLPRWSVYWGWNTSRKPRAFRMSVFQQIVGVYASGSGAVWAGRAAASGDWATGLEGHDGKSRAMAGGEK